MKLRFFIFLGILITNPIYAGVLGLDIALSNAHQNCSGISDELAPMKKMAGINTAVTGVGTLAGGGAIATGFVKQSKDASVEKIEIRLEELRKIEQANPTSSELTQTDIDTFNKNFENYVETAKAELQKIQEELDKLTKQSKNLGNWRTGLMAGSAATNIAGAIIAGNNKVKGDLKSQIDSCKSSINDLRASRMQARMDGEDATKLAAVETIITECGKYDTFDVSKINNRASGAMWSSVAGATTGTAGTITSAIANTDKTRGDNSDSGKSKEKNLNTASNILAIGTTVASGTATVFNATQISAIKKASDIADNCEGALR